MSIPPQSYWDFAKAYELSGKVVKRLIKLLVNNEIAVGQYDRRCRTAFNYVMRRYPPNKDKK